MMGQETWSAFWAARYNTYAFCAIPCRGKSHYGTPRGAFLHLAQHLGRFRRLIDIHLFIKLFRHQNLKTFIAKSQYACCTMLTCTFLTSLKPEVNFSKI